MRGQEGGPARRQPSPVPLIVGWRWPAELGYGRPRDRRVRSAACATGCCQALGWPFGGVRLHLPALGARPGPSTSTSSFDGGCNRLHTCLRCAPAVIGRFLPASRGNIPPTCLGRPGSQPGGGVRNRSLLPGAQHHGRVRSIRPPRCESRRGNLRHIPDTTGPHKLGFKARQH